MIGKIGSSIGKSSNLGSSSVSSRPVPSHNTGSSSSMPAHHSGPPRPVHSPTFGKFSNIKHLLRSFLSTQKTLIFSFEKVTFFIFLKSLSLKSYFLIIL